MQSKYYKPGGWLGIILGARIFIDFTKYEMEECIKRLNAELKQFTEVKQEILEVKASGDANEKEKQEPKNKKSSSKMESWSEKQVENWLIDKKIDSSICELLK